MNLFLRLLLGIMVGLLAWGQPAVTLANGGDVHFGDIATGIPIVMVWVGGGVIVILFLFFFIGWTLSSQAKKRSQEEKNKEKPPGS